MTHDHAVSAYNRTSWLMRGYLILAFVLVTFQPVMFSDFPFNFMCVLLILVCCALAYHMCSRRDRLIEEYGL